MTLNKLYVNSNKTEYIVFNPNNVNLPVNIIHLGSHNISPSDSAKNLGVNTSNLLLNLASFNSVISVAFVLLSQKTAAITLANAFVHSRLDFCNSFFYGLSKYSIHRL